jgi:hypothetical protein
MGLIQPQSHYGHWVLLEKDCATALFLIIDTIHDIMYFFLQ